MWSLFLQCVYGESLSHTFTKTYRGETFQVWAMFLQCVCQA
ncbi:UNVERIFIED_CONTAM: hypothetical protein GTU68_000559 [Idotea baltica]|nr:hypothetical protein [Idotea baltica]